MYFKSAPKLHSRSRFPWKLTYFLVFLFGILLISDKLMPSSSAPAAKTPPPVPQISAAPASILPAATPAQNTRQEKYAQALLNYKQVLLADPHSVEAYLQIGKSYLALRQYPAALVNVQDALLLSPHHLEALSLQAYIYGLMKDYSASERSFAKVFQITTMDGKTYAYQTLILLQKAKDSNIIIQPTTNEIVTVLNLARQYAPNDWETHYASGLYWELVGYPENALAEFQVANQVETDNLFVLLGLGRNQQRTGHYQEAIMTFQKALTLDSSSAETYAYLARSYLTLGELEKSLEAAQQTVWLEPKNANYYGLLGVVQYYNQQYQAAVDSLAIPTMGGVFEQEIIYPLPIEAGRSAEYYTIKSLALAHLNQCSTALENYQLLLNAKVQDTFVDSQIPELYALCGVK